MPGCGSPSSTPPPAPTLTSISVLPQSPSIPVNSTQQFTATGHYSDGTSQDLTTSVTWNSTVPTVALISNSAGSNGLATGVGKGTTTIQATQAGVTGPSPLNITEPVIGIAISPLNPSVAAGIPQQFTATATYADNSTGDVTGNVTWSSSNTAIATISNFPAFNGLASTFTSTSGSTTTIQALYGGISATPAATLTVTVAVPVGVLVSPQNPVIADAGATQQFTALLQYSDGTTQDVTSSATWSSNNPGVATVSAGLATSLAALPGGQSAGFASISASWTAPGSGAVVGKSKKSASVHKASSQGVPATFTGTGVSILSITAHAGNGFAGTFTQHNDIARTGQNINENVLNTSSFGPTSDPTFGKLFSQPVDGQVYAQPLYVPNVTISSVVHNVIYVATENDSIYAFDADSNTGANASPLWQVTMLDAAHGSGSNAATVASSADVNCNNITNQIGITATPVIDPSTNTMYVAAESKEGIAPNFTFYQRIHAIDITTGAEKSSASPIAVAATVPGNGNGTSIPNNPPTTVTVKFNPQMHLSRPGLLLLNGTLYVAYSSNCDNTPYHGWVFSFNYNNNAPSFTQTGVYVTTPNGGLGGIWMSGCGIAGDSNGYIYLASGNGDFDTVNVPAIETGDTLLKLVQRGNSLSIADYFTPSDQDNLDSRDLDLGSGGLSLIPGPSGGANPNLLVQAGKNGNIYLVDRDQMTTNNEHYCGTCATDTEVLQELPTGVGGMWSMPAYWNNNVYFWGVGDGLLQYPLSTTTSLLSTQPLFTSALTLQYPGSVPTVSASGATNGIVWAIDATNYFSSISSTGQAVLHAFDATNVSSELYNTKMAANGRDMAGPAVKFSVPTIANGKVYLGTQTELDVYGVLP
jgi:hypothetical protein